MENNPIDDLLEDRNKQIPVIGVPIVNGLHWLERVVGSIDYPVKNFVIINNSGDKLFTTNLEHKVKAWRETNVLVEEFHLINFPSNMGVAFAWNCIIKSFLLEPYWIISNHDTAFTPGLLEEMYNEALNPSIGMIHPNRGNYTQGSFDLFLIKDEVVKVIGLFDENLYPAYGEDVDYIMRLFNANIIRKCGLSRVHLHGEHPSGDPANGSFVGHQREYREKVDIDEINKENYDDLYKDSGGNTAKDIEDDLQIKLKEINEVNYTYLDKKWGIHWRGSWPHKHPMNNPTMPQSYTTFDLDFVRNKHLGF